MKRILVVGEDGLCCALGERLVVACLPGWQLAGPSIDTRGRTRLASPLPRYAKQARHVQPVLCVADTDRDCPVDLVASWLDKDRPAALVLRFAVTEAESWLLADRQGLATALAIPLTRLPHRPDAEADPKQLILTQAARSGRRVIREEMVSAVDRNKPGSGYNLHLGAFVRTRWDVGRAVQASPSLARAVSSLQALVATEHP